MSTRTLQDGDEERSAKEKADVYIMRLILQPTSAIRHVKSEDGLRTSYGKLSWDMPQYIIEFGPALTL